MYPTEPSPDTEISGCQKRNICDCPLTFRECLAFVKTAVFEHAQNVSQISRVNFETTLNWLTPWSRVLV